MQLGSRPSPGETPDIITLGRRLLRRTLARKCLIVRRGGVVRSFAAGVVFASTAHSTTIKFPPLRRRSAVVTCVTEDPMSPLPDRGVFVGPNELTSSVASECSVMPQRPTQAQSSLQSKDSPTRRAAGQPSFNFRVKFSWTSG